MSTFADNPFGDAESPDTDVDPLRAPSVLVVGFPKSGTSTLDRALRESGLRCAHWKHDGLPVGQLIYDGWFTTGDPLAYLRGIDAVTQMDFCHPSRGLNYWPNLDIALLLAIRRLYPGMRFVLNLRPARDTADSFARWNSLVPRILRSDIPGLPRGYGSSGADLVRWIDNHVAALQEIFAQDPQFLTIDITLPEAPALLGAFLGRDIPWWGVANANRIRPGAPQPVEEDNAAGTQPQ